MVATLGELLAGGTEEARPTPPEPGKDSLGCVGVRLSGQKFGAPCALDLRPICLVSNGDNLVL